MGLIAWIKRLAGLSKDKKLTCAECNTSFFFEEGEQKFFRNGVSLNPNGAPPAGKTPDGTGVRGGDNERPSRSRTATCPKGFDSTGFAVAFRPNPAKKTWRSSGPTGQPEPRGFSPKTCSAPRRFSIAKRTSKASAQARAVIINSGCANACTGKQGLADTCGRRKNWPPGLGVKTQDMLVASTGVIGRHLPRPALGGGLKCWWAS
jgi:hypothetical protein